MVWQEEMLLSLLLLMIGTILDCLVYFAFDWLVGRIMKWGALWDILPPIVKKYRSN